MTTLPVNTFAFYSAELVVIVDQNRIMQEVEQDIEAWEKKHPSYQENDYIVRCLKTLRTTIFKMRVQGRSKEQIRRYCRENLNEFTKVLSEFQSNEQKYDSNKRDTTFRISNLGNKIRSSRPDFCKEDPLPSEVVNPMNGLTQKQEIEAAMMLLNVASMPLRATEYLMGKSIEWVAQSNPKVGEVLAYVGEKVHNAWSHSTIGKSWSSTRKDITEVFHSLYGISPEKTSYALDSFEHLAMGGGAIGVSSLVKGVVRRGRQSYALFQSQKSGIPSADTIYFNPKSNVTGLQSNITPLCGTEMVVNFSLMNGSGDSILFQVNDIRYTKRALMKCSQVMPESTEQAVVDYFTTFAKNLGATRAFLHPSPEVPFGFFDFMVRNYHSISSFNPTQVLKFGPYPMHEILSPPKQHLMLKNLPIISEQVERMIVEHGKQRAVDEENVRSTLESNSNSSEKKSLLDYSQDKIKNRAVTNVVKKLVGKRIANAGSLLHKFSSNIPPNDCQDPNVYRSVSVGVNTFTGAKLPLLYTLVSYHCHHSKEGLFVQLEQMKGEDPEWWKERRDWLGDGRGVSESIDEAKCLVAIIASSIELNQFIVDRSYRLCRDLGITDQNIQNLMYSTLVHLGTHSEYGMEEATWGMLLMDSPFTYN